MVPLKLLVNLEKYILKNPYLVTPQVIQAVDIRETSSK